MTPRPGEGEGEADGEVDAARARRHGRPDAVMPRQVVAGFFESERGRRDSGVLGMKGMVAVDQGQV